MGRQLCGHENATIIFILPPRLHSKNFESLFNNVLSQDGLICVYIGWWIGITKSENKIYDVDIVLSDIL